MSTKTTNNPPFFLQKFFQYCSRWLPQEQGLSLIDLALVVDVILMATLPDFIVLFFHIVFALITLGAFYWNFSAFAWRAVLWISITTGMVLNAVRIGQTQPEEMIEIPLLTTIFVLVFLIARRRAKANRELQQTYTKLHEVEGLRDDLTNMIVHDMRHLLGLITTHLYLIGEAASNPKYADKLLSSLGSADAASQLMMGMIDDLLIVSKFEAGELRLNLGPTYLSRLLLEKEETYRSKAELEGKKLMIQTPAELPSISADARLISRVVDNLINNAFKYTKPGGRIEIEVENKEQALVVRVADDGYGIPPEYQGRIFDKFVQVLDPTGRTLRKGTGLGLTFCRMAVEVHGGKIWVESAPGEGSTFSFSLPVTNQS